MIASKCGCAVHYCGLLYYIWNFTATAGPIQPVARPGPACPLNCSQLVNSFVFLLGDNMCDTIYSYNIGMMMGDSVAYLQIGTDKL